MFSQLHQALQFFQYRRWILLMVVVGTGLTSDHVWAQKDQQVERVVEVTTENDNQVMARKELLEKATDKVIEDLLKEMIGEAKMSSNRAILQKRIFSQSQKFTPLIRAGDVSPAQPKGFSLAVTVRINLKDLQSLLMEQGLFYDGEVNPTVIPMIRWSDRENGVSFNWWNSSKDIKKNALMKMSKRLNETLKSQFSRNAFYFIQPGQLGYSSVVPNELMTDSFRLSSWQSWLSQWGAQVVLDGQVQIMKSPNRRQSWVIDFNLQATQVQNGRTIAEVVKSGETESGLFEIVVEKKSGEMMEGISTELAQQMYESWQKGAIGSSLYKLTVRGAMPLPVQENLKEVIKSQVREIKNVKERVVSQDQTTYELDSSINLDALSKKMPSFEVSNIKFVLDRVSDAEITYRSLGLQGQKK